MVNLVLSFHGDLYRLWQEIDRLEICPICMRDLIGFCAKEKKEKIYVKMKVYS
jgi:hypothetical protein